MFAVSGRLGPVSILASDPSLLGLRMPTFDFLLNVFDNGGIEYYIDREHGMGMEFYTWSAVCGMVSLCLPERFDARHRAS